MNAPVYESTGKIVATIDVSGLESAFDPNKPESFYLDAVLNTASAIFARLDYRA